MNSLKDKIIEVLKQVYDPEIPVDVWDLGLIYDLKVVDDGKVYIKLTLTSPTCPIAGQVIFNVTQAIQALPEVKEVNAELVFNPPWDLSRVKPEGREILKKLYGYDVVKEYIKE